MNTKINIIKISNDYVKELQMLGKQTFLEAFESNNTEENLQAYLEKEFNEKVLLGEINNPDSEFYFYKVNLKAVGYLKVNFRKAQTEYKEDTGMEIQRIYVAKEFLGQNVGQALFQKALEIAVQNKMEYIWLGVWEHNQRAINFYKRNGFIQSGSHIFNLGDDAQTDLIMKRVLD